MTSRARAITPDEGSRVLVIHADEDVYWEFVKRFPGSHVDVCSDVGEALSRCASTDYTMILYDIGSAALDSGDFVANLEILNPCLVPRVVFLASLDVFLNGLVRAQERESLSPRLRVDQGRIRRIAAGW